MRTLGVLIIVSICVHSIQGLTCFECDKIKCERPVCKWSGYGLDMCGCCQVCARQVWESCGGIWNIAGTCDKNLTCVSRPLNFYEGTACLDIACKGIVDLVFAVDGSRSVGSSNFELLKQWLVYVIKLIYHKYGACAHVSVLQYSNNSSADSMSTINDAGFEIPFVLGECTNNIDCFGNQTRSMTHLNNEDTYTYYALERILKVDFPRGRYREAQKIIVLVTDGGTNDAEELPEWRMSAIKEGVIIYILAIGVDEVEMDDLTSAVASSRQLYALDGFNDLHNVTSSLVNAIWSATVNETEPCQYPLEFKKCKSRRCAPTCDKPYKRCRFECKWSGCDCTTGFVRVSDTNTTCIRLQDCPGRVSSTSTTMKSTTPTKTDKTPSASSTTTSTTTIVSSAKTTSISTTTTTFSVTCSENEVFRGCPSPCTPTCSEPYIACIDICDQPKCVCKPGYVRMSLEDLTCVKLDDCPRSCPYPEVFSICPSSCPETCADPTPVCTKECAAPGCVCDDGYVRNTTFDSECVRHEECTVTCSENEVFRSCPSPCTRTCSEPYIVCIDICDQPKCVCKPGYVRISLEDLTCVELDDCPRSCPYPEVFSVCPSSCPETCTDPTPVCTKECAAPGCVCDDGYVRNTTFDSKCVRHEECTGVCDPPEVYRTCSSICNRTCDDPYSICPAMCGPPKCECPTGYVRRMDDGKCIRLDECSAICNPPEVYTTCSSICNSTCDEPTPICPEICGPPKCVCPAGYVRRENDGKCIRLDECPAVPVCEKPKVYRECPTACPRTCEDPYPLFCSHLCGEDNCVCPPYQLFYSLTDRRCVYQYECSAAARPSPTFAFLLGSKYLAQVWIYAASSILFYST